MDYAMTHDVLDAMTDRRAPYKVVYKKGPGGNNPDRSLRSPLKKVRTRVPHGRNRDWNASQSQMSERQLNRSLRSEAIININKEKIETSVQNQN